MALRASRHFNGLTRAGVAALPLIASLGLGSLGLGMALAASPGRAQSSDSGGQPLSTAQVSGSAQSSEGTVMITPGAKGAQMYCFMRANGNNHQVSWDAAYALIKRQSDKLFKTSPEHASVMIAEAVVQNPGKFPDCGRFIGDLFVKPEPKPTPQGEAPAGTGTTTRQAT